MDCVTPIQGFLLDPYAGPGRNPGGLPVCLPLQFCVGTRQPEIELTSPASVTVTVVHRHTQEGPAEPQGGCGRNCWGLLCTQFIGWSRSQPRTDAGEEILIENGEWLNRSNCPI